MFSNDIFCSDSTYAFNRIVLANGFWTNTSWLLLLLKTGSIWSSDILVYAGEKFQGFAKVGGVWKIVFEVGKFGDFRHFQDNELTEWTGAWNAGGDPESFAHERHEPFAHSCHCISKIHPEIERQIELKSKKHMPPMEHIELKAEWEWVAVKTKVRRQQTKRRHQEVGFLNIVDSHIGWKEILKKERTISAKDDHVARSCSQAAKIENEWCDLCAYEVYHAERKKSFSNFCDGILYMPHRLRVQITTISVILCQSPG